MATRVGVDWPLSSGLELGALPTAASCGRLHAKNVVSELVTNALRASELIPGPVIPPIRLRLSSDRAVVLIELWDGNMQLPILTDANTNADGGRGLMLVDALSTRWNWYATQEWGGKVVWAELRV